MVDLVVQLDGVPVRVTGVEHSHDIVHVAHRHGERAGREVADALRVQDAEQSAEFARCWNPATFSVVSTMEPAYIVHGYKVFLHIRSILGWSQSVSSLLPYNPLIRSPRSMVNFTWTKRGPYKRVSVYLHPIARIVLKLHH